MLVSIIKQNELPIEYEMGMSDVILHLIDSKGPLHQKGIDFLKLINPSGIIKEKYNQIYLKVLSESDSVANRIFCL